MQCFLSALAYSSALVSYVCKMFTKLTPVVSVKTFLSNEQECLSLTSILCPF
jgi:hypothetical protein